MNNEVNENLIEDESTINRISLTNERDSGVYYNDFDYEIDKPINPSIFTKINYLEINLFMYFKSINI